MDGEKNTGNAGRGRENTGQRKGGNDPYGTPGMAQISLDGGRCKKKIIFSLSEWRLKKLKYC